MSPEDAERTTQRMERDLAHARGEAAGSRAEGSAVRRTLIDAVADLARTAREALTIPMDEDLEELIRGRGDRR